MPKRRRAPNLVFPLEMRIKGMAAAGKDRKPWTKPLLRRIDLTSADAALLRAADDPAELLLKFRQLLGSDDKALTVKHSK